MSKKHYETVCHIRSLSVQDKHYTIKKDDDGNNSCSCASWRFQRTNPSICPDGKCKHLRVLDAFISTGAPFGILLANHYKVNIEGADWEMVNPNDEIIETGRM